MKRKQDIMGDNFFISKRLEHRIRTDVAKRTKLAAQLEKDVADFIREVDYQKCKALIAVVLDKGLPQEKEMVTQLQERLENGRLTEDDALEFLEFYKAYFGALR